jgi:hypothetical protein
VFGSQAATYVIRGRRHLWGLRPSVWLVLSSVADVLIISTLAVVGDSMAPLHIAVISGEFAAAIAFGAILDVIKIPFFARLHIACTAEVHQVFKGFDKQNREDQHEDRISPYRELLYISASARVSCYSRAP